MKKLLLLFSLTLSLNFAIGQGSLACNKNVQVSVDDACDALIHPDMVLEGTYADYDDYEVRIYKKMPNPINSPGTEPNPIGPGKYIVGIFDKTGNNCWGRINVQDKLAPTIECECPEGGAFPQGEVLASPVSESFSLTDDKRDVPNDCAAIALAIGLEDGSHYYDVYAINVSSPGVYTFTGTDANTKLIIGIFDEAFDATSTCDDVIPHLIGQYNQDNPGAFDGSVALEAGKTYYVVLSDLDADYVGDYDFSIATPVGAEVTMAETFYNSECKFAGCFEEGIAYAFPAPTVKDNCTLTADNLKWKQTVSDGVDCGTYIVKRYYTVTDGAGMTAQCTSEFFFKGVDINNLEWPNNWDGLPGNHPMLECNTGFDLDAKGNPHPSETGYPSGFNDACGTIEVFYNDQVYTKVDGVPCGTKILRYWTLVDDCTGVVYEKVQIIRITDNTAPTFHDPIDFSTKSKAYECNADVKVPIIEHLSDNCDAHPRWWVTSLDGTVVGDTNNNGYVDADETWYVNDLPLGEYSLCYHVIDDCGNEDVKCIKVTVFDGVPPISVCEQHKQVSITAMGNAKVFAHSFDSGSFDNCNPVFFKVLRVNNELVYDGGCPDLNGDDKPSTTVNDVWYDDDVFFCCEDVDNGIMVSLRVFDVDPGNGAIKPNRMQGNGDLVGHYNDCWSIVNLECKIPPALDCQTVSVSCEESLDPEVNTKLYPEVTSVCGYELDYTDKRDLGVCGAKIIRTWTATGCGKSVQCRQKIIVEAAEPFDPCTIKFPKDILSDCADELAEGGEPVWDESPCNVVTAEFKDDTFRFVDGACYKIVRNWAVVDWCLYEPNYGYEDNVDIIKGRKLHCGYLVEDGYYRYTQILMVTDSQIPTIEVEDQCFATTDCYAYDVSLSATASDQCNVDQKFNWKYIVTNMDTWETIQYSYNYTPKPIQGIKGSRAKDNLDRTKTATLELLNELPVGNYRVTWTVGDGCGNADSKNQFFTISDKKAPTPILVDLATAVMANGMVELTAISFDKGGCENGCISSTDNCTPKSGLYFTFSAYLPKFNVEPLKWQHQLNIYGMNFFDPTTGLIGSFTDYENGDADAWLPGRNTSQRRYTCDFVADANYTKVVKIYVWDNFAYNTDCDDGNYEFANVEINFNHCATDPHPTVSGIVTFVDKTDAFEGMEIVVDNGENTQKVKSNSNGEYSFNLNADNYSIKGSREIDYLNGVTTLDIVLIQKYLLGLKEITNPYYLIAADANKNGKISAADILEIRNVILGSKNSFTNSSWVALAADYQFDNPKKAYRELDNASVKDFTIANSNISDLNFIAVKIGDLNGSAVALESRSASNLNLAIDNVETLKGKIIDVPFYAKDFNNVFGLQFTMNLSNIDLEGINSGAISINESNFNISGNNLVVSWNNAQGVSVNDDEVLFTLSIKALSNSNLKNILNINSDVAKSEAYKGSDLEISTIALEFRNNNEVYNLYQNEPNPFLNKTVIGFDLPLASEYTLTIYDVTGKEIKIYREFGEAGYNKIEVSNKEINTSGVLYYRLESGEYTATKKMIIIK